MQIRVRINEEGVLRNQRHAFSNRYTLVTELLQNARRAGATRIEVHHDRAAQRLVVQDDGHGLEDFQKLLSLHESGWDAATCVAEQPFGVGFSKCLYAARRCIVHSGRRRVEFDTADALARAAIEVDEVADVVVPGTRVELHGVELDDLAERLDELCIGFAVPVCFNGAMLSRPWAEAMLKAETTPIGTVHLAGADSGLVTHDVWVFLQGFCVLRPAWSTRDDVNVVHLDPRQFRARLPDRDRLIDEDVQRRRIDEELKACWRRTLLAAKAALPRETFVSRYHAAMRAWGHLDLLNDVDVLPPGLCSAITGYPVQDDPRDSFLEPLATAPTRQQVERGDVVLVALDPVGDDNGARWMLARALGWRVFDWLGVSQDHWAMAHVRFVEDHPVQVRPVDERLRTALDGRWVQPVVVLCRAVQLHLGDRIVTIDDAGVCHRGAIYVPDGEATGQPVRQFSSYTDEHERELQSEADADREALADLLRLLRAEDPAQTLDSLLQTLGLARYPLLHGRTFRLTVGVGTAPGHSVDLVAAGGPHA